MLPDPFCPLKFRFPLKLPKLWIRTAKEKSQLNTRFSDLTTLFYIIKNTSVAMHQKENSIKH